MPTIGISRPPRPVFDAQTRAGILRRRARLAEQLSNLTGVPREQALHIFAPLPGFHAGPAVPTPSEHGSRRPQVDRQNGWEETMSGWEEIMRERQPRKASAWAVADILARTDGTEERRSTPVPRPGVKPVNYGRRVRDRFPPRTNAEKESDQEDRPVTRRWPRLESP